MTKPETQFVECEKCGGLGDYDMPHPMWGSPSCPEAYVNVKCDVCDCTGKVEVDVEMIEEDNVDASDDELFGELGAV